MTVPGETDLSAPRFSLSLLEFDVLIEHLGLDPIPLALKVPSPGRTHTERAELVESAWSSLTTRDLGHPTRPDPDLEALLRLLVHPDREIDGRLWFGHSIRVLAAASNEQAVLAVKERDTLTLRPAASTGLPREAASVLPPQPAGPGRSVSIRGSDLDAAGAEAGGNVEELQHALHQHDVRADDAEELQRMVGEVGPRGQFGAAARDRWHRRVRAGHVVGFFDGSHGRYVQLRRDSGSGDPWSTIAPVDERRLVRHIEELLGEVIET